jgi:hypothetical protein
MNGGKGKAPFRGLCGLAGYYGRRSIILCQSPVTSCLPVKLHDPQAVHLPLPPRLATHVGRRDQKQPCPSSSTEYQAAHTGALVQFANVFICLCPLLVTGLTACVTSIATSRGAVYTK